jgi:hypothetical protein
MQALENIPNPLLVLRSDSDSIVLHANADFAVVLLAPDIHFRLGVLAAKLQRIRDEIEKHLGQHLAIAEYINIARNINFYCGLVLVSGLLQRCLDSGRNIQRLQRHVDATYSAVVEQVLHLGIHASGRADDFGQELSAGAYEYGNVFKLTQSNGSWTYTDLYDFTGGSDGANPVGALILDGSGDILGTTVNGGSDGYGVAFEITP